MSNLRQPASISYRGRDDCPTLCSVTGPDPGNWPAYHSLSQVAHCKETVFYHCSIYDDVDDGSSGHRIYACTSYGALQKPGADMNQMKANADPTHTPTNVTLEFGGWNEMAPHHGVDLRSLSRSVRRALAAGYTSDDKQSLVLFVQTVTGTAGLYLGKNVNTQSTAPDALIAFENALYASNNTGGSKAIQLCGHDYDGDHVVGFIATSNTSFTPRTAGDSVMEERHLPVFRHGEEHTRDSRLHDAVGVTVERNHQLNLQRQYSLAGDSRHPPTDSRRM